MTAYTLERRQVVPGDLASVFAFFKDPRNLERLTPPWLRFHVRSATDDMVRAGTRIQYTLWLVLPMRWESLIAEYRENEMFADEMLRGPYKRWYHTHRFRAVTDGVEIHDQVEYELPLGLLGRIAHAVAVRWQLAAIFDYRAKVVADLFRNSEGS